MKDVTRSGFTEAVWKPFCDGYFNRSSPLAQNSGRNVLKRILRKAWLRDFH